MGQEQNVDDFEPKWEIIEHCLTYYNQEEDKDKYLEIKKIFLQNLRGKDKLNEIKNYSEQQVDDFLKSFLPLKVADNVFYNFIIYLNLGQCVVKEEILDFFNKEDFSIYSLYKIGPKHIYELIAYYKRYLPPYAKLVDEHFYLYCNIHKYFTPSFGILRKIMKDYINLSEEKLKLLRFTEREIRQREKDIEEIKEYEQSFFDCIYNCFFSKKEKFEKVKIKNS